MNTMENQSLASLDASDTDATKLWLSLRQSPAQPLIWLELARYYATRNLPWQAGYAAKQALRLHSALEPQIKALNIHRPEASADDALLGRMLVPNANSFVERFSLMVKECPGDWLSWLYLARLLEMPGVTQPVHRPNSLQTKEDALHQARSLEPLPGETLHWMGAWRLNSGDAQGAVNALAGLLDIRPVRYGSMMYLGEALFRIGNIAAAEKAFARASLSDNPSFLLTLSTKVYAYNYWQEAIEVLQKAISIKPDEIPVLLALAKIQSEAYRLKDCRETLQRLQDLSPNNEELRLLEAGLQGRMGDANNHLAILQAIYDAGNDPLSRLASSIAMTSLYNDTLSSQEVFDLHRRLCAPIETAVAQKTHFTNSTTLDRRLRIGYVTGDLYRQHPVNIFMLPVFRCFNHDRLEICVYYTGTMHDEYTRQAKQCSDRWLDAAGLDDRALQQAIIGDEVDILVDLAGHTSTHRLGLFAARAAPVQATFLGYPHSTGLSSIDWLVGDSIVSPDQHAHLFSEGRAQLPQSVFCWAPVDDYPLPAPRSSEAPIVFGSFNNAMKLSPRTIELWANILHSVNGAKLLLKAPSFSDETVQTRFADLFGKKGISPDRLIFRGPSGLDSMMQEYGDIDIALDPAPYNGGTTTLQALWMGVPVITMIGDNFVGRMGASFLTALNRPDWLANNEAEYVNNAIRLAEECASLRRNRSLLRERMASSPLCDIESYVKHLELLFHRMWEDYCNGNRSRVIKVEINGNYSPLPT